MHNIAMFLDNTVKALKDDSIDINDRMLIPLAALDISDELLKARDKLERIKIEAEGLYDMTSELQSRRRANEPSEEEKTVD